MSNTLNEWNNQDFDAAVKQLHSCCSAQRWAEAITKMRPIANEAALVEFADQQWATLAEDDWLEAFQAHPRIGERKAKHADAKSLAWSQQEQVSADTAQAQVLADLANLNALYEERNGFTYIVCATGKSADEMLHILRQRLNNERSQELKEAAEQQRQIMQIRLRKWLNA